MAYDLTITDMARALARHSATRQSAITDNIANADTPGFKAKDVRPFAEVYEAQRGGEAVSPRSTSAPFTPAATRGGHVGFTEKNSDALQTPTFETTRIGADSPNGNSVSLEDQIARGAEAVAHHQMALGVLQKAGGLVRLVVGRGR